MGNASQSRRCAPGTHVSDGYKRTEVGVIPTNWSVFSLAELFYYLRTASNSRSDLGDTGVVAYVHYGDLHTRFRHFIDFSRENVPRLLVGTSVTATRLRDGDLIVADASEDEVGVGKSVEVRNLGATEAISGLHTLLLRSKDRRVHYGYRGYLLEKAPVKEQLRRLATGLKVFGISKRALRDVRVPLPPPDEQRAIAEALSDVDGLFTALEALIAKKRAIKQAAMQQLLTGKTRLPGFSRRWETKRLGGVAYIKTGSRNNQDKVDDGQYLFFVRSATVERINSYTFEGEAILVPGEGDIGGIFHYINGRFDVHQRVYKISRFSIDVCGKFVYYNMVSQFGVHAKANTVKATVDSLRLPTFKNFSLSLPSDVAEQRAIAAILSDMDAEIAALERRRDKTRAIKQGMMQQLLTGRVRFSIPACIGGSTTC